MTSNYQTFQNEYTHVGVDTWPDINEISTTKMITDTFARLWTPEDIIYHTLIYELLHLYLFYFWEKRTARYGELTVRGYTYLSPNVIVDIML